MYMKDKDLIIALKRSSDHLIQNPSNGKAGLIFIKENVELHKSQGIIRSIKKFEAIFEAAGLEVVCREKQPKFPKNLNEVMLWVLKKKEIQHK